MKKILLSLFLSVFALTSFAQKKRESLVKSQHGEPLITSYQAMTESFSENVLNTNKSSNIVTGIGFNYFLQKKLSYYLTGSTGINYAKTYATFNNANDRLALGYNFVDQNKGTQRIRNLYTPIFEADINKEFSTLFKNGNWQSDIRFGFKWTHFIHGFDIHKNIKFRTKIKYNINKGKYYSNQRDKMRITRTIVAYKLLQKMDKEEKEYVKGKDTLLNRVKTEFSKYGIIFDNEEINENYQRVFSKDYQSTLLKYNIELGKNEADSLETVKSYNWFHTAWFSTTGSLPITPKAYYISPDPSQLFSEKRHWNLELSAQGNYLNGFHWGKLPLNLLFTLGYRFTRDNSALSKLINPVDYDIYSQFPGRNPLNLAKLETKKAYIGNFQRFITHNINFNVVFNTSSITSNINGGISLRIDKNFGFYDAIDIKIGLPIGIQGKESIVNIEPQVRFLNINNYANVENYKLDPIIGINVGLPFIALYK